MVADAPTANNLEHNGRSRYVAANHPLYWAVEIVAWWAVLRCSHCRFRIYFARWFDSSSQVPAVLRLAGEFDFGPCQVGSHVDRVSLPVSTYVSNVVGGRRFVRQDSNRYATHS